MTIPVLPLSLVPRQGVVPVILPNPPAIYDAQDQKELRRAIIAAITAVANKPDSGRPWIDVRDYRVVGDGIADDTIAMQAALDAGTAQGRVVDGRNLIIKITGPLTGGGPGLVFDSVSYGNIFDPIGIHVTGTGYTGLTWNPVRVTHFNATIWGDGQVANGLYFNHITGSQVQRVRVNAFNGFGCKIDKLWDSIMPDVSVEQCGTDTLPAFSFNGVDDTCNMSHIGRLQVEQAKGKAIFIEGNTLSCLFDNIHSERCTPTIGVTTWDLGGGGCVYTGSRFTAQNANGTLHLSGENTTYTSVRVESNVAVTLDATGTNMMTLVSPNFFGSAVSINLTDHSGLIEIIGGMIATLNAQSELGRALGMACYGTRITTLSVGICGNPANPAALLFDGCEIGTLASASTLSAATFRHCAIAEGGNLLEYQTVLDDCLVACASTLAGRGCIVVRDSTINANVLMNAGATLLGYGTRFNGTLGQTTNCSSLLDAGCYATGAVTGLGIPTTQPAVAANVGAVWRVGQRHHNLAAAVGSPTGWICTTAGGTGVFVFTAESNAGGSASSVGHSLTAGAHLSGGPYDGSASVTLATDATNVNTGSTIVARNSSGISNHSALALESVTVPQIDCSTNSISIVNNGTATVSLGAYGSIEISDISITGDTARVWTSASVVSIREQTGTSFTTTIGTGGKTNFSCAAGVLTIENKQGGTASYRISTVRRSA